MKLAVFNDWFDKKSAVFWNKDGFLKALQVLRDDHGWEVKFFKKHDGTFEFQHECVTLSFSPNVAESIKAWKPDALLHFGDFSRPILDELKDSGIPMAMCLTGGLHDQFIDVPDIVLTESSSYVDWLKGRGVNVVRAFGTNTELFHPMKQPKIFDVFFPATFAGWKRHDVFAQATKGLKSLAAGYWQPHEATCWQVCQDNDIALLHHQPAESVNLLYNMSKTVLVTSDSVGGSQRTVLEAMACNIPIIVSSNSEKNSEYLLEANAGMVVERDSNKLRAAVEEMMDKEVNTRDFIMENYSEWVYASQIKEAVESIL